MVSAPCSPSSFPPHNFSKLFAVCLTLEFPKMNPFPLSFHSKARQFLRPCVSLSVRIMWPQYVCVSVCVCFHSMLDLCFCVMCARFKISKTYKSKLQQIWKNTNTWVTSILTSPPSWLRVCTCVSILGLIKISLLIFLHLLALLSCN